VLPDNEKRPPFRGLLPGDVFVPEVLPVRLSAGIPAGTVLKEVHGTLTADVQASRKLIAIKSAALAQDRTFRLSKVDASLRILDVQRTGDRLRVKLHIDGPLAAALSQEGRSKGNRDGLIPFRAAGLSLLDGKGKAWKLIEQDQQVAAEGNGDLAAEVKVTFHRHAKQEEPTQLVVRGAVTMPVEIPFVLRDVPVPKG
jgi:hypothetical protein